jgi:hypothetical protein
VIANGYWLSFGGGKTGLHLDCGDGFISLQYSELHSSVLFRG